MKTSQFVLTGLVVGLCMVVASQGQAQDTRPLIAPPIDICALMDQIVTAGDPEGPLAAVVALLGDDAVLLQQFACDIADLNGPPVLVEEDMLPGPNGLLDGRFEFGILAELVNNAAAYADLDTGQLPGQVQPGVDSSLVLGALNHNYLTIYTPTIHTIVPVLSLFWGVICTGCGPITPEQEALLTALFPTVATVVGAYATLGDDDTMGVVMMVVNLLKDIEIVQGNPTIGDIQGVTEDSFQRLGGILGPDGDADGDGFSNRAEYEAFSGAKGAAEYVQAALDPSIQPEGGTEGEGEGEGEVLVTVSGPSLIEEGDRLELKARTVDVTPLGYQWSKLNTLGTAYVDIPNEIGASYIVENVQAQDEGYYRAGITYDDGTKAILESFSAPFFVDVVPEGTLPIAGGLGIALLAGACAFAGAVGVRRKK